MKYTVEYFDRTLNEHVIVPIEADTTEKARRMAHKILQYKDYDNPGLYNASNEVTHDK